MHSSDNQNIICFIAHKAMVDIHYHQCYQIVFSLQNPFDCTIDGRDYRDLNGFVVNQGIAHSCRAKNTSALVYFIDSESYLGWQLKQMLGGAPFLVIEALVSKKQLTGLLFNSFELPGMGMLKQTADELLRTILPSYEVQNRRIMDERVITAAQYIEAHLNNPMTIDAIAEQIFLSPERARHLFAQETGIPLSQYLLWKRLKKVLIQMVEYKIPMAEAVLQNGFTDQPHFSRLFKRTFGISPSQMLKNSRSIQFLMPEL
jgi:AraC-like DNA-binding protein